MQIYRTDANINVSDEDNALRASRAKTEFLSNISHEMRTPLNVIIGMCDVARRHIDDREKVEECLMKINIAGEHLTQLVNNVLDINRIEQGKLRMAEDEFSIDCLMDELNTLLEPLACDKSIVLSISSREMVNRNIIGDYGHIMQILINLASNAVKYTPQGGFVKLWAEEKENPCPDKVSCRFVCQDNGIGMSEEFLAHVYEPFARADDARIHKVNGAGLGMSIVREIVDALGGEIHIESAPDMGTTVTVDLELATVSGNGKVEDIAGFKQRQIEKIKDKRIILIAEDHDESRETLTALLEELDYEVDSAGNGEQVVDLFIDSEEGYYKAILMDMDMPVMDGCQATLMIRGLNRSDSDVPVIAMTAHAFEEDKREARRAGMDDHLTKPVGMDRLEEMLGIWMTESVEKQ